MVPVSSWAAIDHGQHTKAASASNNERIDLRRRLSCSAVLPPLYAMLNIHRAPARGGFGPLWTQSPYPAAGNRLHPPGGAPPLLPLQERHARSSNSSGLPAVFSIWI